jgi:hypothetical protein
MVPIGLRIGNRLYKAVLDLNDLSGIQLRLLYSYNPNVQEYYIYLWGQRVGVLYEVEGVG